MTDLFSQGAPALGAPIAHEMPPLEEPKRPISARMIALFGAFIVAAACLTVLFWKARHAVPAPAGSDDAADVPHVTLQKPEPLPHGFIAPTESRAPQAHAQTQPAQSAPAGVQIPAEPRGFVASLPIDQPGTQWRIQPGLAPPMDARSSAIGAPLVDSLMVDTAIETQPETGNDPTVFHAKKERDPSLTVAAGTSIGCVMKTAIDSTRPGLVSCIVTEDIASNDARITLIEKGTQVTGEYRADVRQGEARIGVIWKHLRTPAGASVDIDSQAADASGSSGIPGSVDNHWFDRIGSAFLLSFIEDGVARIGNNQNGAAIVLPNTTTAGATLGAKVLDASINIAPTIAVAAGTRINILVARDLDFSSVYALR
jgi:type IV secretion system protein VirB10